jgi:uncharacterized damage-inducible protein DinB
MDLLDRLLDHDQWATGSLLYLCRSRDLADEALDKPFDIGHRTLRETFGHMIVNIETWTGLMCGRSGTNERPGPFLESLIDRFEHAYRDFSAFARRIRDEQRLDDTFIDHFGYPMTFGGAIIHVILHHAEHRTEILHILGRLGEPDLPEVDHGLWDHISRGAFSPENPV